jgi:hypothetical protein
MSKEGKMARRDEDNKSSPEDHHVDSNWELAVGYAEELVAILRLHALGVRREFESRGAKKGVARTGNPANWGEGWGGPAWRNHDEAVQEMTRADVALRDMERINELITGHLRWLRVVHPG